MSSNINDSFDHTRLDKTFANLMRFEQNGTHSPPFSQTIQAVLSIGRDSHCYAQIDKEKKMLPIMHAKMDFSRQNLEQK
jgi:hypothetical protein